MPFVFNKQRKNKKVCSKAEASAIREALGDRSIVLVGLMGAGKTAIGRRLAQQLNIPFIDADDEIEQAAGKSISDIFAEDGEDVFRNGEKRVIARLLDDGSCILATGGGAYMDEDTRQKISESGVSVWLKANLDILFERVSRRDNRPLLQTEDPKRVLKSLMDERYPIYQQADIIVQSRNVLHDKIMLEIVSALKKFLKI
ncbi:MAG: shikimate kinase [Methyloligellaceae bacterium]